MSNLKDFATGIVAVAPSPASSGTELELQAGQGDRMPVVPFKATVCIDGVTPDLDTAEEVWVTDVTGDTLTFERAQGDTTAKSIDVGWRLTAAFFSSHLSSLQSRINVKDYGAKGDGATDDYAAIQAAIDDAGPGKNRVYFPSGNYMTSEGLVVDIGGVVLEGDGAAINGTRITSTHATDNIVTFTNVQAAGITGIQLGHSVKPTDGFAILFEDGCFQCFAIDIRTWNCYNGIGIDGATETDIRILDMRRLLGTRGILFAGNSSKGSYGITLDTILGDAPYPEGHGTVKAWTPSTAYSVGDIVAVNNAIYQCTTAGTSAGSGGPSGIPGSTASNAFTTPITDGSAEWLFVNNNLVWFNQDSYAYSARIRGAAFLNGRQGVLMDDGANTGSSYPMWLHCTNVEIDHSYANQFLMSRGEGVFFATGWVGSSLSAYGMVMGANFRGEFTLSGTRVMGCAQGGILINGGQDASIVNNVIGDNSQSSSGTFNGVTIGANVGKVTIVGNKIGDVVGVSGNPQGYGVAVIDGTGSYINVADNIMDGNVSGDILVGTITGVNNHIQGHIGSYGYALPVASGNQAAPTDSQTIYSGMIGRVASTTEGLQRVYIPKAGMIKKVILQWSSAGTAGSGENISISLRVNATTDYLIATVGNTNAIKIFDNSAMNSGDGILVQAGDFFEIKQVNPSWATNPTNVVVTGSVFVE